MQHWTTGRAGRSQLSGGIVTGKGNQATFRYYKELTVSTKNGHDKQTGQIGRNKKAGQNRKKEEKNEKNLYFGPRKMEQKKERENKQPSLCAKPQLDMSFEVRQSRCNTRDGTFLIEIGRDGEKKGRKKTPPRQAQHCRGKGMKMQTRKSRNARSQNGAFKTELYVFLSSTLPSAKERLSKLRLSAKGCCGRGQRGSVAADLSTCQTGRENAVESEYSGCRVVDCECYCFVS